jgi:hypothetical protein
MNKIVLEHYPVEKLPDDVRAVVGDVRAVTFVIEPEASDDRQTGEMAYQRVTAEMATWTLDTGERDSVERVRALRDEWDD